MVLVKDPIPLPRSQELSIVIAAPDVSADMIGVIEESSLHLTVKALVNDAGLLEDAIKQSKADIVFIHQRLANARAALGHYIFETYDIPCVLLVDDTLRTTPDLLDTTKSPFPAGVMAEAHRAGCFEVAGWPPSPSELRLVAHLAIEAASHHNEHARTQFNARGRNARVVGFRSGVDGVGTTEMAINVAALVAHAGLHVALVDLHVTGASLHHKLRLPISPNATGLHLLSETVLNESGQHADLSLDTVLDLGPYVLPYPSLTEGAWTSPTRVNVILGIEDRAAVKRFGDNAVGALRILDALRASYDVVILDLGSQLSPTHIQIAAHVDELVIVTTPVTAELELIAASHARLVKAAGLRSERCHILVNFMGDPSYQVSLVEIATRFEKDDILGAVTTDMPLVRRARAIGYPPPALLEDRVTLASSFRRDMQQVTAKLFAGMLPSHSVSSRTTVDLRQLTSRVRGWLRLQHPTTSMTEQSEILS